MTETARKIREGDVRSLARLASGVENRDPAALEILRELAPFSGRARVIGVTGPPGAGKSTLVDAMTAALRRQGKTVGIVAVDPSSRMTGGAVLGDRIRMQQHHADAGVFIRSMATRGTSGGLARATTDVALLLDGAGKDYVIIETVGVGQDEVNVASLAHVVIVVLVPGMGDDVQAIKAGILEIATVFAINKADQPGAERVERELKAEGWKAPMVMTVATEGKGVGDLLAAVDQALEVARRPAVNRALHIDVEAAIASVAGARLDHIALRVPDLAAAVDKLRSSGAQLLEPGDGHVFASTAGVLLELIQEESS